jgi:hypothetical protein
MIIKPSAGNSYRTLFITELGIKIFDMEFFRNSDFKLHYCLDELNRGSIIRTLKNDLSTMLETIPVNSRLKMMQEGKTHQMIIKSKDKSGVRYCFIDEKTNKVDELVQTGNLMKKLKMRFYSSNGFDADSIKISHYNFKLKIHLSKLNETKSEISE